MAEVCRVKDISLSEGKFEARIIKGLDLRLSETPENQWKPFMSTLRMLLAISGRALSMAPMKKVSVVEAIVKVRRRM